MGFRLWAQELGCKTQDMGLNCPEAVGRVQGHRVWLTGPLITAKALTPSRLDAGARPTSELGDRRQLTARNKFMVEIWKLALKAFSSSKLAEELWGQMSTVPGKGDTVMVKGQSAKGKLLLRAPSM